MSALGFVCSPSFPLEFFLKHLPPSYFSQQSYCFPPHGKSVVWLANIFLLAEMQSNLWERMLGAKYFGITLEMNVV